MKSRTRGEYGRDNNSQQRQAKMPAAGATQALRLCRKRLQFPGRFSLKSIYIIETK